MKEHYEKPEFEIIKLTAEDIICSSEDNDNETPVMPTSLSWDDEL